MRAIILAVGLALPATGALAQNVDCARDQTQMALNFCAKAAWERSDGELNRLWRQLKPKADAQGWGQRLLTEQRAWLKTRDARCEAERDEYAGGSIAPLIYWTCMEDMTVRRNADFRAMM